jgi:hypothetical protein
MLASCHGEWFVHMNMHCALDDQRRSQLGEGASQQTSYIGGVAENSARQVANICSDYLASAFDTTINDVGFATL